MNLGATALAALLVTSVLGAAAAPAATQGAQGDAYSGTFVQFETADSAVTDYAVDGTVVVENVTAQSAGETEGGIGIGADASSSTTISGSAISSQSSADARASVAFESGAEMEAHDNQRGVVQFTATDDDQVVQANVSGEATSAGDERVVVRGDDGSSGTFIVVGDGNVTTNADGRVTARVEQGSQLVYRQYDEERSESDKQQERMIRNGTAAAEVYVYGAAGTGNEAADDGDETAQDGDETANETAAKGKSVVTYGQNTTVEVTERSADRVNMTVERTESQGKVVITTVSESAVESTEDLEVYVDGEAAAQADSYGEVRSAAQGGDQSAYLVQSDSSASAATDVVVGVNHFSERSVAMRSAEDGGGESTATDESEAGGDEAADGDETGGDGTDGDGAGFGVLAALVALAAALIAVRARP